MSQAVSSKELPSSLQPYERCLSEGPGVLNDAELLAVILRTGSVGENSVALASRILSLYDLPGLTMESVPKLTEIRGIGKVKAIQLQCLGELCRRYVRTRRKEILTFDTPSSAAEYCMEEMCREEREKVVLLLLDAKCRLIHDTVLSVGTIDSSPVTPREIFLEALKYHAVRVILLHNHPSGDPEPSEEDLLVTQQIRKAGELLSVPLIDHIIIGDHTYVSLNERGFFQ